MTLRSCANTRSGSFAGRDRPVGALAFRALVKLKEQELVVQRAFHDGGRER